MSAATVSPTVVETDSPDPHRGFSSGEWIGRIDVRDFIQRNYAPYEGDDSFLEDATQRTNDLWAKLDELFAVERERGVLDVSQTPSSITAHEPGYIDRDAEIIVGLQTDAPLKRAIFPNGGWRMVVGSLKAYGYRARPGRGRGVHQAPQDAQRRRLRRVHAGDPQAARSAHIVTGLPDAYGRGRIIGDYRRDRAVRRGPVDRGQEGREGQPSTIGPLDRGDHPRTRGALRADQGARRAEGAGREAYGFDLSRPRDQREARPCSGSTSATWPRSKSRTAPR